MAKTTNRKYVCIELAKQAGLFIADDGSCIKLTNKDKSYFELSESEILFRFDKWNDCMFFLKGILNGLRIDSWNK